MTKRLAVAVLLFVTGCAERGARSPLAELAKAPLQAGIGLGELKLMQTTLGAFSSKFGLGESVVTPDQSGTKIDFIKAGLALFFRGDPACAQGIAEHIATTEQRDVNGFLLQNPSCERMVLESIAAYIPAQGEPLYEGETVEGIGLNAARELAERAYQATQDAVTALETGVALPEQPLPQPNELHSPGIRIYLGKDERGREVVRKLEIIPHQN